jgi:hypothetical protein
VARARTTRLAAQAKRIVKVITSQCAKPRRRTVCNMAHR